MNGIVLGISGFVALQHIGFSVLEMFFWTKPAGMKVFRTKPDFARASAALAANQGLYNLFLAAGLIWGICAGDGAASANVLRFFLSCVFVAGIFGGLTVNRRIAFVQALPAAAGLAAIHFWTM